MQKGRQSFEIYKGLQRPLIFKFFKGKFIYWALGSIVIGIIAGGAVSILFSAIAGALTMVMIAVPLLFFTISKQKQGLHSKKKETCVYIIPPKFKRLQLNEK